MDSIRILKNPDRKYIDFIIKEIIRTEDWNKTKKECEIWRKGHKIFEFYVAIDETSDEPAGSISITMDKSIDGDPEDDLFYIGNFYTCEGYRGIGLGKKLFTMAMERTNGRNVNLNAVAKLADFYDKKFGFSFYPKYFNLHAKVDTNRLNPNPSIHCLNYKIVDLSEADFDAVVAYDRSICPRERSLYLKEWMTADDAQTKVAIEERSGKIVGFCCAREQLKNRLSVGPFYAENKEIALILVNKLLSRPDLCSFDQVWFRFPQPNEDAISVLDSITDGVYLKVLSTKSQFNQKLIEPDPKRIFSVFEAGHSIV